MTAQVAEDDPWLNGRRVTTTIPCSPALTKNPQSIEIANTPLR